jgi:hypothetical protein
MGHASLLLRSISKRAAANCESSSVEAKERYYRELSFILVCPKASKTGRWASVEARGPVKLGLDIFQNYRILLLIWMQHIIACDTHDAVHYCRSDNAVQTGEY